MTADNQHAVAQLKKQGIQITQKKNGWTVIDTTNRSYHGVYARLGVALHIASLALLRR